MDPVGADRELFRQYLEEHDPCFGFDFAKTADECKACTAPVVIDGELYLLREVCKDVSAGADTPTDLNRLTSQDVRRRRVQGKSVEDIFWEIVGDSDPRVAGVEARSILYSRFKYLHDEYGLPMPDIPRTDELIRTR